MMSLLFLEEKSGTNFLNTIKVLLLTLNFNFGTAFA